MHRYKIHRYTDTRYKIHRYTDIHRHTQDTGTQRHRYRIDKIQDTQDTTYAIYRMITKC